MGAAIELLALILGHCLHFLSSSVSTDYAHDFFIFFLDVCLCVCAPSPCALPCALPCLHAWMLTASEGQPIIPNQVTLSGTGGERKLSLELILVIMGHILTLTFFFSSLILSVPFCLSILSFFVAFMLLTDVLMQTTIKHTN